MNVKIKLYKEMFSMKKRILFESDDFTVSTFKYGTTVDAVVMENSKGYVTVLPFLGQMIWDMEFLGHNMVMKSIYDEPEALCNSYSECYGCFMMHCGLSAIGNPKENDNHIPHGELPYGIRWIARTDDEDAMGMVLPATAEHKGRSYSRLKGQQRYLKSGESVTFHITTGILSPTESNSIVQLINK